MTEPGFTTSDFHNVVHKHIVNAAAAGLAEAKFDWQDIAPFLATARDICRADFRANGLVQLHTVTQQDDQWIDAEEAFVGVSASDQDDGNEWLSETFWLSDVVTAGEDPEHVRSAIRALERTVSKLNAWLDAYRPADEEETGEKDPA